VVVVTGAHRQLIEQELAGLAVNMVHNANWEMGMASSIIAGISSLRPEVDQVIIMLCDQPFANAGLLQSILEQRALTGKPIVACSYGGSLGVPALFHKSVFAELLALQGQEGAKKVILKYHDQVAAIHFEKGIIDIDTPEDITSLQQNTDRR
jgi:molybdenum cofactor cytidylyltransferase